MQVDNRLILWPLNGANNVLWNAVDVVHDARSSKPWHWKLARTMVRTKKRQKILSVRLRRHWNIRHWLPAACICIAVVVQLDGLPTIGLFGTLLGHGDLRWFTSGREENTE